MLHTVRPREPVPAGCSEPAHLEKLRSLQARLEQQTQGGAHKASTLSSKQSQQGSSAEVTPQSGTKHMELLLVNDHERFS